MNNLTELAEAFTLAIEKVCEKIDVKTLDWFNGTFIDITIIKD